MKKFIFLSAICILISCGDDNSVTDLTQITKVNSFITKQNRADGVTETKSKVAAVFMSHSIHENKNINCADCHHKKNNDERIKTCSFCHKGLKGTKQIHSRCMGCHEQTGSGPVKCESCHIDKKQTNLHGDLEAMFKKTFEFSQSKHDGHSIRGTKCSVCHHDSPDTDKKKKNCNICHEGDSKTRIMHNFCKDCHVEQKKGPVSCTGCHKVNEEKVKSFKDSITLDKTGHSLPQIVFNHKGHIEKYNTECVDCHHNGSLKKCSSCHLNRDQESIINLKGAYHQQCQDCHRKTSGPRSCVKCHTRGSAR